MIIQYDTGRMAKLYGAAARGATSSKEDTAPLIWVVGTAVLFVFLFATTIGSVVSTHREVAHYVGMPAYVGVVPQHVEAAILEQLPRGSSSEQVQRFLSTHSIGRDANSVCANSADSVEINCQLGIEHHFWELIRETYTISFQFSAEGNLRNVSAHSALFTGRGA